MKSALAGATRMASASRLRLMWGMALGSRVSHWDVWTARPESACMVVAVMKRSAPAVMTTCTVAPALISWRHNSADL